MPRSTPIAPPPPRGLAAPTLACACAPTWGKPVRMLARLGEQLLTEVKAFWKSRLRRASASRLGVRMAELLADPRFGGDGRGTKTGSGTQRGWRPHSPRSSSTLRFRAAASPVRRAPSSSNSTQVRMAATPPMAPPRELRTPRSARTGTGGRRPGNAGCPGVRAELPVPGGAAEAAGSALAPALFPGLAAARPDGRPDRGAHRRAAGPGVRRGGRAASTGFLLDFISCPVIKGFTSAASITISFNQVKNILGLQGIPRQFFLQVYEMLRRIGETRAGDAVLGLSCLAALAGLRAMKSHLPRAASADPLAARVSYLIVWTTATARNALVVLFAGLVAYSFQVMGSQPLTLTGSVPQGLPPFRLPRFSLAAPNGTVPFETMVEDMGVGLAVVPLMGLLETVVIAKAFASQNNYRIDPNQELLAMGFANILGSFVSSYPITGSFGRTAVNAQSGVCTPAGGLVTGALVLLSLAYLTSPFYYIPKAALAAIIISAVVPMFDAEIFRTLWRVKRLDLVPLCVTFLLCFWEVQYGILAGMLVSGILLLYSIARPSIKVSEGDVLLVQPRSSLHFPAIRCLQDIICSHALAGSCSPSPALCRPRRIPAFLQTGGGRLEQRNWGVAGQPPSPAPARAQCCPQDSSSELRSCLRSSHGSPGWLVSVVSSSGHRPFDSKSHLSSNLSSTAGQSQQWCPGHHHCCYQNVPRHSRLR
ncbi:sodium-independent sulfate anion transporter [Heliangelus exortis]|uniref:sodium-independent sulfate anion transporter n=1 Tax=Heliangelus exortis TaxID=472823 RepID=UPI003A909D17